MTYEDIDFCLDARPLVTPDDIATRLELRPVLTQEDIDAILATAPTRRSTVRVCLCLVSYFVSGAAPKLAMIPGK